MDAAPLRVGIISAAWGAQAHLPAWRSLDGVEVVAICTSRPETAAQAASKFKIARAYHDFRTMAEDPEIDLLDCGTRPALRRDMVLAAFAGGKHVYNGIPFARNSGEAHEMVAAWEHAGKVAVVDAFMQAVPAIVQMKALIEDGWIGEVFGADIAFESALFTAAQTNVPGYAWFADPANGASALRNLGSHMLHLLVHFFGPVQELISDKSLSLDRWPLGDGDVRPLVPDRASMLLRHRCGLPTRLEANWAKIGGEGFRFSAWGERGRLEARAPVFPMAHDTRLYGTRNPSLGDVELQPVDISREYLKIDRCSAKPDRPETGLFALASVFAAMRESIHSGGTAAPDFRQALHVQEVIELADSFQESGCWFKVT